MRKQNWQWKRLLCVGIAAVLFLLGLPAPVQAQTAKRKLRVSYIGYEGFAAPDASGIIRGYCADYLSEIGLHAGLDYEWVYTTWQGGMEMLQNHQIDLVCMANYTAEREAVYQYSRYSFGTMQQLLYALPTADSLYYNDFASFDGKRIGVLAGSKDIDSLALYAAGNGFHYQEIQYGTDEAMHQALANHEIDLLATESLVDCSDLKLVGDYGTEPYYLISYQNNDFMSEIDDAMREISQENPDYTEELTQKYYGSSAYYNSLRLTRQESEYIQQAGPIAVGQMTDSYPLSLLDQKTGALSGINEDILAQLAEISGLQLESVAIPSDQQPIQSLLNGNSVLVMGTMENSEYNHSGELALTHSYLESRLTLIMRKGSVYAEDAAYTVALKKELQSVQTYVAAAYPDWQIVLYDSDEECMTAVLNQQADLTMENVYVMNYLMQKPKYENLEMLPTDFLLEKNQFVGLASVDPALISILNKSIAMLENKGTDETVLRYTTARPYQMTLSDTLYKYRMPLAVLGIMLGIVIALSLSYISQRHRSLSRISQKNQELALAVQQAQKANAAKSEFLSRMSHDIRTPMNGIIGMTRIAREQDNPPKTAECLDRIAVSSDFMLGLINDVLDMSKIESGTMELHPEPYQTKEFLQYLDSVIRPMCNAKKQNFLVSEETDPAFLPLVDKLRFNQIVFNLLANAVKYTPNGGTIRFSLVEWPKGDRLNIVMQVSDNGCGMSEEFQKVLFEPYTQEDRIRSVSEAGKGTGLGLAIVKKIVDLCGGTIQVFSRPGKGSTFTVKMTADMQASAAAKIGPGDVTQQYQLRVLHGRHVLICEDNQINQEIVSAILTRCGITADIVPDGQAGVERFAKAAPGTYDAILMDLRMPVLDGYAATREIRALPRSDAAAVPIIAMTADAFAEDIQKCRAAGMNAHIAKPINPMELYQILADLTASD